MKFAKSDHVVLFDASKCRRRSLTRHYNRLIGAFDVAGRQSWTTYLRRAKYVTVATGPRTKSGKSYVRFIIYIIEPEHMSIDFKLARFEVNICINQDRYKNYFGTLWEKLAPDQHTESARSYARLSI